MKILIILSMFNLSLSWSKQITGASDSCLAHWSSLGFSHVTRKRWKAPLTASFSSLKDLGRTCQVGRAIEQKWLIQIKVSNLMIWERLQKRDWIHLRCHWKNCGWSSWLTTGWLLHPCKWLLFGHVRVHGDWTSKGFVIFELNDAAYTQQSNRVVLLWLASFEFET
jgi:hypothetical protein